MIRNGRFVDGGAGLERPGADVVRDRGPVRRPAVRDAASLGIALTLAIVLAACASSAPTGPEMTPGPDATSSLVPAEEGSPVPSGGGASAGPSAALASPVQGLLLHVDLAGLGKVTGFRLLTADGTQLDFKMGVQENAAEFPAAHLSEHMSGGQPVLVYFRQSGSDLVVYRLEDAPAASGAPQPGASGSAEPTSGAPGAS